MQLADCFFDLGFFVSSQNYFPQPELKERINLCLSDMATLYTALLSWEGCGTQYGLRGCLEGSGRIIIELRKKVVVIPQRVMNDLKSAKVLMKIMDASEKDRGATAPKIEQFTEPRKTSTTSLKK
jgi:hypothetical protein